MEALITAGAGAHAKAFVAGKGAIAGGLFSGITTFATMETVTGNTALAIAVSAIFSAGGAALTAFFVNRPKYVEAISHAKLSESELLGKETAKIIAAYKKQAIQLDRINSLQVQARHDIQGFLQAYYSHIELCHMIMREKAVDVPPFEKCDVKGILKELDRRIDAIKSDTSPGVED